MLIIFLLDTRKSNDLENENALSLWKHWILPLRRSASYNRRKRFDGWVCHYYGNSILNCAIIPLPHYQASYRPMDAYKLIANGSFIDRKH